MLIDDKPIKFQVDCGSSINILPKEVISNCSLAPTSKTLIMWNKTEVTPLGTTRIIVTNPQNRKKYSVEFVVVTEKLTPLIGARAAQHMKLLTVHWNNFKSVPAPKRNDEIVHQLLTVQQVVTQDPKVFKRQRGRFPGVVKIEVDANVQPVVTPTRRIPTALKEKFNKEIDRLQNLGVIAPVDKPTPWVSSVVVATKTSGALRICIDPRPLNAALKRERYQLPILEDLNWDKPRYSQPLTCVRATGIASWMKKPVYSPRSQHLLEGTDGAGSHLDYLCPLKYSRNE